MIFTAIRPALLALVKQLAGLEGVWRDQPNPYTPPGTKAILKLSLSPTQGKGQDARTFRFQSSDSTLRETVSGYRIFTLRILCECLDQSDGATALNYLETLRTRLRWTTTSQALHAVRVAFIDSLPTVDLSRTIDNRVASIAALDVRLATMAQEENPNPVDWIETVRDPVGTLT